MRPMMTPIRATLLFQLAFTGSAAFLVASISEYAIAETVVSRLTIEGEIQSVERVSNPTRKRIGLSERGRNIEIDEFAIVRSGPNGIDIPFATAAFDHRQRLLSAPRPQVDSRTLDTDATVAAISDRALSTETLVISHQRGHSPNHLYTPTPKSAFIAQFVGGSYMDDQRGFAVVDIGESGRVLRVKLLNAEGRLRNRLLESAIAGGIRTDFLDHRRHGHTVYMVYEVRAQTMSQIGSALVTLPNCGPPPPGECQ